MMKQIEGFSTENLIKHVRLIGLPSKIVFDVGTNFVSGTFQDFLGTLVYIRQCYHHTTPRAIDKKRHA